MPVIRVTMWKGRSKEQKMELARALTEVMVGVGKTSPQSTHIVFEDVDKENWAIAGVLCSEQK